MTDITFDTLKYAERLAAAGVPEAQAKAEAHALAEVLSLNLDDMPNRRDLKEVEARIEAKLTEAKADLLKWVVGLLLGQTALLLTLLPKLIANS
ncbi:MAG TPA: hypothetical protein VJ001_10300 [Rhodocyclaceae bacterium]|nr:hypothetical protein [Rhodocyclaceae bacterium]